MNPIIVFQLLQTINLNICGYFVADDDRMVRELYVFLRHFNWCHRNFAIIEKRMLPFAIWIAVFFREECTIIKWKAFRAATELYASSHFAWMHAWAKMWYLPWNLWMIEEWQFRHQEFYTNYFKWLSHFTFKLQCFKVHKMSCCIFQLRASKQQL